MYDKYTARPAVFLSCNFIEFSPFYSALNIVFGAPAGYCVPVWINDIKILTFWEFSKK